MRIDAYTISGENSEGGLRPDELIRQMQKIGIDKCLIAPVERCLAVANREGNDLVLDAAEKNPDKFIPACTVNPWFGPEAISEVESCISSGARMVVLAPHLQGFILNDGTVFPLLNVLRDHALPVYVHTGHYEHSTPWQLADIAMRYPRINFIMGHCGSTDFKGDAVTATLAVDNIYLESSLARSFVFRGMLKQVGHHKGIMGSSAPLNPLEFEWRKMEESLPYNEYADIYGKNFLALIDGGRQ